jgi:membrane-bound lytic murein transglycosylase D
LIGKIFLTAFVLFLSLTCLSPVAAQNNAHSYFAEEDQLSLQQESDIFHLQEWPICYVEESSSNTPPQRERPGPETLELPFGDSPGDDSSPEIFLKDQRKKESDFDIPIVINTKVEQFIQYFQTTFRDKFGTWLARSEKYIPFMKNLLKEQGLPEDLVYIAFIESGFDPYAYSRSKASGLWQFIRWTGKRYGLRVDWWVDERRDPEKSTIAAAKYLKDLYETFECWYLAAAGYNAGEYKIIKAMKRYRTEDFWKLTKYRYLKRETKNYVPQMIAAALIAKDPEKYGFTDVEYEEPLQYEKVKVPELTALSLVAKACETSLEEINDLNPELQRGVTPPNEPDYEIKIPSGKKDLFLKNFEALEPLEPFKFKTYRVKKGDTLGRIAKSYRVDLKPLLLIPISKDKTIKPLAVAKRKNGKVQNHKPEKRNLSL